jgi:hypothetical protein
MRPPGREEDFEDVAVPGSPDDVSFDDNDNDMVLSLIDLKRKRCYTDSGETECPKRLMDWMQDEFSAEDVAGGACEPPVSASSVCDELPQETQQPQASNYPCQQYKKLMSKLPYSTNQRGIQRAYRKASRICHPDKPGGSKEDFECVKWHYDTRLAMWKQIPITDIGDRPDNCPDLPFELDDNYDFVPPGGNDQGNGSIPTPGGVDPQGGGESPDLASLGGGLGGGGGGSPCGGDDESIESVLACILGIATDIDQDDIASFMTGLSDITMDDCSKTEPDVTMNDCPKPDSNSCPKTENLEKVADSINEKIEDMLDDVKEKIEERIDDMIEDASERIKRVVGDDDDELPPCSPGSWERPRKKIKLDACGKPVPDLGSGDFAMGQTGPYCKPDDPLFDYGDLFPAAPVGGLDCSYLPIPVAPTGGLQLVPGGTIPKPSLDILHLWPGEQNQGDSTNLQNPTPIVCQDKPVVETVLSDSEEDDDEGGNDLAEQVDEIPKSSPFGGAGCGDSVYDGNGHYSPNEDGLVTSTIDESPGRNIDSDIPCHSFDVSSNQATHGSDQSDICLASDQGGGCDHPIEPSGNNDRDIDTDADSSDHDLHIDADSDSSDEGVSGDDSSETPNGNSLDIFDIIPELPDEESEDVCIDKCRRLQEYMRQQGCGGIVQCKRRPVARKSAVVKKGKCFAQAIAKCG